MGIIEFFRKGSIEDRLYSNERRLYKKIESKIEKGKIRKAEKLAIKYNDLVDTIWELGPSKYPLDRFRTDLSKGIPFDNQGRCNFRGCEDGIAELIPHLFGTFMVVRVCDKLDCQKAFLGYLERRGLILKEAYRQLLNNNSDKL